MINIKTFILIIFCSTVAAQNSLKQPEVILGEDKRLIKAGETDSYRNGVTYIVEGDIVIERGGSLTIEAGTTLKFRPNSDIDASGKSPRKSEILVYGELIAKGEAGSEGMIIFTSYESLPNRRAGDWYGITIFKNKDNKESILANTKIEYASSAVNIVGSNPLIIGNWINYNLNNGIYVSARSEAVIAFNQINDNVYAGLDIRYQAKPKLYANFIFRNDYGIMIFDSSVPHLGDRTKREVIIGENLLKGENILSGQNIFHGNASFDIYNNSKSDIKAENNSWDSFSTNSALKDLETRIYDKKDKESVSTLDILPIRAKLKMEENYIRRSLYEKKIEELKDKKTPFNKFSNVLTIRGTPNFTSQNSSNVDTISTSSTDSLDAEAAVLTSGYLSQITKDSPMPDIYLDPGSGQVINKAEPVYTGQARNQGIAGKVKLKLVVDVNGKVKRSHIIHSDHQFLNQLAINDSEKMSFAVGFYKGQRVYFTTSIIINYINPSRQSVSN